MTQVAGGFEHRHLSRVPSRILLELRPAAGRAEVVRRTHVLDVFRRAGGVDVHPAHRVSDHLRPSLRSARVGTQHVDSARRYEAPSQTAITTRKAMSRKVV